MSDYPPSNACHCCGVWCNYELVPVSPTSEGALCGNCAGLGDYENKDDSSDQTQSQTAKE